MRILDFADGFSTNTTPSITSSLTVVATQTISEGGEISEQVTDQQLLKVVGNSAPVTASLTPFGSSASVSDGAQIIVMGTDNTDTVKLSHNDAAGGLILNGDATLGQYDQVKVYYDASLDRYIETGRNF